MKITNQELWDKGIANNQDSYGAAIYQHAETWANLMESQIEEGKTVEEVAKTTSQEADTDGITGFMYGVAVAILSQTWEHGEELRRWHNLDLQIKDEGEKANESGGVLNPSSLFIG